MRWLLLMILPLTLNPAAAQPNQPRQEARAIYTAPSSHTGPDVTKQKPEPSLIKAWIYAYSVEYNVEPAFAMAVAHIESRKGSTEFRCGQMGKTYFGPMGLHKCFRREWDIADPETNVRIGVRTLRNTGKSKDAQRVRLQRYNKSFNEGYWRAIASAASRYRRIGISE